MGGAAMTMGPRVARLRAAIAAGGWALVPLRLVVGFGFAVHGYAKLARGPAAFAAILSAIGIPAPVPTAWATTLLELGGGIAIMLGAAVLPFSLPLIAIMATAIFGVHFRYGFSWVARASRMPAPYLVPSVTR